MDCVGPQIPGRKNKYFSLKQGMAKVFDPKSDIIGPLKN